MMYEIDGKKVFVFCAGGANIRNDKWYAIILEEKGNANPETVHYTICNSQEECEENCEANFRRLYPTAAWRGFIQ